MNTPIPPATGRPGDRPSLSGVMLPENQNPPHGDHSTMPPKIDPCRKGFKATWKPLLLGFGIGVLLVGGTAGTMGYVWHQNDVKEDRAKAKDFAAEKSGAVKAARAEGKDEGVVEGTQQGYAKYKQEAEQQAAAAKEEAQKPYQEASAGLDLAKKCLDTSADKNDITFTDHSVTLNEVTLSGGPKNETVGCVFGFLGMDEAVLDKMFQTRALDGRQTDAWGVWDVSWSYHPEQGLNVVAEIQDAPAE